MNWMVLLPLQLGTVSSSYLWVAPSSSCQMLLLRLLRQSYAVY